MQKLKIISSQYINHNVKRFVLEKPEGFIYRPGQSGSFSINLPEWEDKKRPYTFTSLNAWPYIELIIKIYPERKSVSAMLDTLNEGTELLLHEVYGSIDYKGPGIFIAGGTGITPFIPIFRALYYSGNLRNIGLLYSNHTKEDVILGEELFKMLGPAFFNVFTREGVIGFLEKRIDRKFLIETIQDFNTRFYVCGPKEFTEDICRSLMSLGVKPESLVI